MNDIGVIHLSNGGFTLVDADLFPSLNQFHWSRHPQGYVYGSIGKNRGILMHRFINKTPSGLKTDHRNRFRLDNRTCNLRNATSTESVQNRPVQKNNKSGFKGVSWHDRDQRWVAQIRFKKKSYCLGLFKTPEAAAAAYDEAARRYFGEFAVLNNNG